MRRLTAGELELTTEALDTLAMRMARRARSRGLSDRERDALRAEGLTARALAAEIRTAQGITCVDCDGRNLDFMAEPTQITVTCADCGAEFAIDEEDMTP